MRKYDNFLIPLDSRCGLIPCSFIGKKVPTINSQNKFKTPHIGPSLINIFTNLPILFSTQTKLYQGKTYQFLDQIPLKHIDKTSPTSIQYFPKKICYKRLTQNTKMDAIEILLINAENNELISLDENFILNLDFRGIDE